VARHERNRERVAAVEYRRATRRRDAAGRREEARWHLTLSESGHVHCSPLILVLAVALSNASIGGSRRFELLSISRSPSSSARRVSFRFHRDATRKNVCRRDRKALAVEVSSKKYTVIYARGESCGDAWHLWQYSIFFFFLFFFNGVQASTCKKRFACICKFRFGNISLMCC